MNLFWNKTGRGLVASLASKQPVTTQTLVLRDTEPLSVAVCSEQNIVTAPWLPGELGAGETLLLGIKATRSSADYLASQSTWTLTGAGSSARYTADLNLNTVELIAAMTGLDTLACVAELTLIRSDGEHAYSTQFALTILKDVNVGTEGAPVSGNPPLASVAFVVSEVAQAVAPSGGSVRIHGGQLQVWSKDEGIWCALWAEGVGTARHLVTVEAAT